MVVLFTVGLCMGSFVNALVWRLYQQSKSAKQQKLKPKDLSIVHGRSMCVHCHHTLGWQDLLPVFSWLSLGGKCRYCKKPISWQYPVVELLTAILFIVSYIFWPSGLGTQSAVQLGLWLVILVGFMALIIYDLKWMLLPDRIVFPLQGLAALSVFVAFIANPSLEILQAAALGVLCSAGLFYALFQVSDGKWIGGGDVKLGVVLGLLLGGPVNALLMLFIASSIGSLIGLPLMLQGKTKRNMRIPFGPCLIVATIIVYLFGASLIAWYKRQFLFV